MRGGLTNFDMPEIGIARDLLSVVPRLGLPMRAFGCETSALALSSRVRYANNRFTSHFAVAGSISAKFKSASAFLAKLLKGPVGNEHIQDL